MFAVVPAVFWAVAASGQTLGNPSAATPTSPGAGAASAGGGASTPSNAGQAASQAGPGGAASAEQSQAALHPNARPSPFGYGELSYQPRFTGCGFSNLQAQSILLANPALAEIQPRAAPTRNTGRYFQLSVLGSEIYTDNLDLEPDGSETSDLITEIAPTFNACTSTGRFQGNLTYQLQGLVYANNGGYNDVYNDVAGDTTIALIPAHFFLGADVRYGQTVTNPAIGFSRSNAINPGNQTGTLTTNISPYLLQSLGPVGNARLRYRFGTTQYNDSDIPDSTLNGVYFDLSSPRYYDTWSWQASAFTQRIHRSGGRDFDFALDNSAGLSGLNGQGGLGGFLTGSGLTLADLTRLNNILRANNRDFSGRRTTHYDKATLQIGYQLTPLLQLLARGGLEDDYQSDGNNDRLGSTVYNVGFRYTTGTSSLEARIGHRFFGTSYFVQATHSGRFYDLSVEYREEPSSQALDNLNGVATTTQTSFAQPTTSPFQRGVFLQKRLSASLGLHYGITDANVAFYRQKRNYQVSDVLDEKYTGGDLRIDYHIRPRIVIRPAADFQHRDRKVNNGDYDNFDIGIAAIRAVSRSANASIGYRHGWRDSDIRGNDYDENRVVVQFRKSF